MTYAGEDLEVGQVVATGRFGVQRMNLLMYAGASGDFNVIHWNERLATAVGLPNVIAHGMFTMSQAGRVVTDWVGDPGRVESFGVRFTKPVVVPDDDHGAHIDVTATVAELLGDGRVRLDITAEVDSVGVLGNATAVVRLPA